jgi:DNA polymerase III delta prime subunit
MNSRRIILAINSLLVTVNAVFGNIVANVLQAALGEHWKWVVVPFVIITIILLALELREDLQNQSDRRLDDLESRNRRAMIEKVRAIWITGVLNESLYKETLITLGLAKRPDAVERPMDLLVQRPDKADQHLPPGARIIDVYDGLDRALLILGAPGSGKTTLLLELARDLLDRAEQNSKHPIPVVFPLSTWAEQRLSLTGWLVDELSKRYDVPRKVGQAWVADDQILPLLDGLDEVKGEHRAACVEAINTFRQSHGLLPLVICSRIVDFEAIGKRLRLQGAIVVQSLTHDQVDYYLQQGGEHLAAVRQALREDPSLWGLLGTPLMLNIVTLAYAGQSVVALQRYGTLEERRRHVLATYTDQMFKRRSAETPYSQCQTVRWLAWLARTLKAYDQSVFYLEWMQPNLLLERRQQQLVTVTTSFMSGLLYVLLGGLLRVLVYKLFGGLTTQLSVELLSRSQFYEPPGKQLDGLSIVLVELLVMGLLSGLSVGIQKPLVGALVFGLVDGLRYQLLYGYHWLFYGLIGALIGAASVRLVGYSQEIKPVEKIQWSWAAVRDNWIRNLLKRMSWGLGFGLLCTTVLIWSIKLPGGLSTGVLLSISLGFTLIIGLIIGLVFVLFGGLRDGWAVSEIRSQAFPNEGIRRSGRNAFIRGLSVSLGIMLVSGLVYGGLYGLRYGVLGLSLGLSLPVVFIGFGFGLRFGGRAWLHHFALRLVLWRNNFAPLQYIRFLDYATARIFLHKVGGGYIFIHRYLLEYFASLDVDSKTEVDPKV